MNEIISYPTLYKRDKTGNIREWRMERRGDEYRTVSNVQGGAVVESEWKLIKGRGIGKSARDGDVQAQMQIASIYKKRKETSYHEDVSHIDRPIMFNPMLAGKYSSWPGHCYSQPKFDGMRCVTREDGMWSRNGKEIFGAPHIYEALEEFFERFPDAIIDGELYNHDLKDDFNTILSCVKKQKPQEEHLQRSRENVQYHIYDIASHDGNFGDRIRWLKENLPSDNPYIVITDTREHTSVEDLDSAYGEWLEAGYEGQMIRLDAPYENTRTKSLLKRKEFIDEEFQLVSINEGQGNWRGVAKSVTCLLQNGRTFNAGIRGTRERAASLLHETNWVAVTVRYQNLTPDGVPRFPVVVKFWDAEATNLDRQIALQSN
jgi:DNA ligase-1